MATPVPVQYFSAAEPAGTPLTVAVTLTGGNFVSVVASNALGTLTISDTLALAWTAQPTTQVGAHAWTAPVPPGGGGADVITIGGLSGATESCLSGLEVSGQDPTAPIDVTAVNHGTLSGGSGGTVSVGPTPGPASANELAIVLVQDGSNAIYNTQAFSPALASQTNETPAGTNILTAISHGPLAAQNAESFSVTVTAGGEPWSMWIIVLKGPASASSSAPEGIKASGAYARLVQVLGRVLRFRAPAPVGIPPVTPPPLPGISTVLTIPSREVFPPDTRSQFIKSHVAPPLEPAPRPLQAIRVKGPIAPGRVIHPTRTNVAPPLIPAPRPAQVVPVKGPRPPGRVVSVQTHVKPPLIPSPRPLQAIRVKGPIPPGGVIRVTQKAAPLIPAPAPVRVVPVKGPRPPGAVIPIKSKSAPLRPNPRAVLVALVRGPRPPGAIRTLSALAQLRPNPRALLRVLVRGPIPPGAIRQVTQRLAPLRPAPRRILALLVRGPVPPGSVRRVVQQLGALRPNPRPLLRVLVRGPIAPGRIRQVRQQLAPLIPTPRAVLRVLVRGPIPPGAARWIRQHLAPLIPVPRAITTLLDRNEPHAFPGRIIRILQHLAPAPPIPAGRPIQEVLDRHEPHAFTGRVLEVRPHLAPLRPLPRALIVLVDRHEPKPFSGHVTEVRPHLAPIILIPAPPPIKTHLDVQPYKTPFTGGKVIPVTPHVAPVAPFVLRTPLLTGTRRHPTRRNIITWPSPPSQPTEVH